MAMIESFGEGVSSASRRIKGYIQIGQLGQARQSSGGRSWRPPEMLDHFRVTLPDREDATDGAEGNRLDDERLTSMLVEKYGSPLRRIPVVLPGDVADVYSDAFVAYAGQTEACRGYGKTAIWTGTESMPDPPRGLQVLERDALAMGGRIGCRVKCPGLNCPVYRPTVENRLAVQSGRGTKPLVKCRVSARIILSIVGDETLGAYHQFSTRGFHSCQYLRGSLLELKAEADRRGVPMWAVPLELVCGPKRTVDPETRKPKEVIVVWLEFRGDRMALIETAVGHERRMIAAMSSLPGRCLPASTRVRVEDFPEPPPPQEAPDDFDPETGEVFDGAAHDERDVFEDTPEAKPEATTEATPEAKPEAPTEAQPPNDIEKAVAIAWKAVGGRTDATRPHMYEAVRSALADGSEFPAWGPEVSANDVDDLIAKLYTEGRDRMRSTIVAARAAIKEASA